MSTNQLITFSGERYHDTTKLIVENGPKFGATAVKVYDNIWLYAQPDYIRDAAWLLTHPRHRGCGWFVFKPYTILHAVNQLTSDDDAVFFIDGDTYPIASLAPFFDITRRDGIMLFMANGWPHARVWTKHEAFIAMGLDTPRYWDCHCAVARFMGFTRRHIPFLTEWYQWCLRPECNTFDLDPTVQQLPGFREGRCEQAIMGLMAERDGIKLWREADEFGDTKDDTGDDLRDRDAYQRSFTQIYGQSYAPGLSHANPGQGSAFRNV